MRWVPGFLAMTGCIVLPATDDTGSSTPYGGVTGDPSDYDALVNHLDQGRTEFGGEEIGEMYPAGNTIWWLEYRDWDPTLHSLDTETDKDVDYAVPLRFDTLNVRVDEGTVGYAEPTGGNIVYHLYDAGRPNDEITTVTVTGPSDGQRWYAYAVDGTDLYVVVTPSPGDPGTKLFRASKGGQLELVTTLESAGCDVGEFWDFGVDGDTMVFIESGRIWTLDLAANEARWLGNEMQVQGTVEFTDDGVLFTAWDGSLDVPWFFDYQSGELTNVAEQIAAVDFRVPGTSDTAHWYDGDITRWGNWYVYGGGVGIFAFDPDADRIEPIVLEPNRADLRIVYRYPVVTDNGRMFVTGLESTSGSVGADGPIWEVDLTTILD